MCLFQYDTDTNRVARSSSQRVQVGKKSPLERERESALSTHNQQQHKHASAAAGACARTHTLSYIKTQVGHF